MTITYHGHSCFKLKGKNGLVATDPFDEYVGFKMPAMSTDIVTISHDHKDHNQVNKVKGTSKREVPFVINHAGEYEVGGISVFGVQTYHDTAQGADRGENIVFTILIDQVRICHLGDLGHMLTEEHLAKIGMVDVLLIPVGGVYTIGPEDAIKVIRMLEPSIVVPMHYKTSAHAEQVFGDLATVDDFVKVFGAEPEIVDKLNIERDRLPEERQLVVLKRT